MRLPRLTRRRFVRGAAAAAIGAATGATLLTSRPGRGGRIQVAVIWSGLELDLFRQVTARFTDDTGLRVEVTSAGDDIDAFLRARRRAGNSPDVAILSRPGFIRGYVQRGWLSPLRGSLGANLPPSWRRMLHFDHRLYGMWVKAAHKSMVWYRAERSRDRRSQTDEPLVDPDDLPETWDDLVRRVRRLARAGTPPLAMGAADGWVLTDWFENLLAAHAAALPGDQYCRLAGGDDSWDSDAVRSALSNLADIWGTTDAFPGGGRRALLTQFDQSVVQLATGEAAMLYGADFVRSVAGGFLDRGKELRRFRFPSPTDRRPLVVSGDAAVVFDGSEHGHELVKWLAGDRGADAFKPWARAGGYLSPSTLFDHDNYPDALSRSLATEILDAGADLDPDLSDQLPALLSGQDGQGTWAILQDFFADIAAHRVEPERAIDRAVERLNDGARRYASGTDREDEPC